MPIKALVAFLLALCAVLQAAEPVVYVGGGKTIEAMRVAVDSAGNRYVTGVVYWNTIEFARFDQDIFLTKIAPDGAMVYTIYFGGDGIDHVRGIAVDGAGRVYLVGSTTSFNFPVVNALQPRLNGSQDAFLCRLTPAGGFDYCTFLGGSRSDSSSSVAVDASGAAYLTGDTLSTDFPVTAGAFQRTSQPTDVFRTPSDAFVTKVSPDGRSLIYSTYLGGRSVVCIGGSRCIPAASRDAGAAIAVDTTGKAYVAGRTNSSDFPVTAGALQTACECDFFSSDVFITKLNPVGSALVFSTYLGGRGPDIILPEENVTGMAIDRQGDVVITGTTWTLGSGTGLTRFPTTPGAFQPVLDFTGQVPFVTKLSSDGSRLVYSTFLSGRGTGTGTAIALDETGSAFVTGTTSARDFPVSAAAFGRGDNFYAQLDRDGAAVLYSTLFPNGFAGADITRERSGRIQLLGPGGHLSSIDPAAPALPPLLGFANAAAGTVTGRIVPGELFSVFGPALGPDAPLGLTVGPDERVTTELGGIQVLFNGRPAPLTYAQKDQINAVVPMLLAAAEPLVEVVRSGRVVASLRLSETPVDPQVFRSGTYAAAVNQDGTLNSRDNPARVGSVVAIYATGLGRTFPTPVDGQVQFEELPQVSYPTQVRAAGGRNLEVVYAGQAPGLVAGVMQVNFRIEGPVVAPPTDLYFRLVVGGVASPELRIAIAP